MLVCNMKIYIYEYKISIKKNKVYYKADTKNCIKNYYFCSSNLQFRWFTVRLKNVSSASSVDGVCIFLRARALVTVCKMAALVSVRACLSGKLQNALIFPFSCHWHYVYAPSILRDMYNICAYADESVEMTVIVKTWRMLVCFPKQGHVPQAVTYIYIHIYRTDWVALLTLKRKLYYNIYMHN